MIRMAAEMRFFSQSVFEALASIEHTIALTLEALLFPEVTDRPADRPISLTRSLAPDGLNTCSGPPSPPPPGTSFWPFLRGIETSIMLFVAHRARYDDGGGGGGGR